MLHNSLCRSRAVWFTFASLLLALPMTEAQTIEGLKLEHGKAKSGDVEIHYAAAGKGPLVVMIHGFPDYWYSWRKQMPELAKNYRVVAIDQRGYNLSSQPEGVAEYAMPKLVGDVAAVLDHFKADKAVIVGHDWGGIVAWTFAMTFPQRVDRLVILNLPHPRGLIRELANNPEQQKNSQYARDFQKPDAAKNIQPSQLAGWVSDPEAKKHYIKAFERSSIEGMLNYYKANYPRTGSGQQAPAMTYPQVKCPVLMFHGLKDKALLPAGLSGTWDWIDNELTLVTIPNSDHFVQQDAADLVTRRMASWLRDTESK